jgi:cobalt-zinc-cadmium efflux system membrane fusion protein
MKLKLRTLALSLAGGAVLAGGGYYLFLRATPAPQADERPTQAPGEPGVLRFAPGAMQLSSLRMQAAVQAPLPLAEPLNGRVAYNENLTARVSSAVSGRVLSLRAQPGDAVKAGDTLLVLDSPDYAAAVSDVRKAEAEQQRKR